MQSNKVPVIIDTDPGIDDVLAILLALASPELEILAFIVTFGNTDVPSSYLNILKLYQALSRHFDEFPDDRARFPNFGASPKPLLVFGAEQPLEGGLHSAKYFHGRDGLGGITERHPDLDVPSPAASDEIQHPQLRISDQTAVSVILDLIMSQPSKSVTYLAMGPLTNLANVMRTDGDTFREHIGRVISMGGALDVPGNTTPVAEFNFFADPFAVHELLCLSPSSPSLNLPLDRFILLTLDITTPHELRFSQYRDQFDPAFESTTRPSVSADKSPLVHFTSAFLERAREAMLAFGNDAMELHDIVATWCAIECSRSTAQAGSPDLGAGWRATKRRFEIERTGEITRGMLVIDRRQDIGAYAEGANRSQVHAALELEFSGQHQDDQPAMPAPVQIEDDLAHVHSNEEGVWCIVQTPGPAALLDIFLSRVWGV